MNRNATLALMGSLLLLAGLVWMLAKPGTTREAPAETLLVYCAAGMSKPMEEIAAAYEKECGVRVQLQFGGSGTLLSNIKVSGAGDVFLAADNSYLESAQKDNLIDEVMPAVRLTPVLVVPKGNPKEVISLDDLTREGLRVCLANPDTASIGRVGQSLLQSRGLWSKVEANVMKSGVFKPTVNDIANDLKIGAADVGLLWDAMIGQYPELESLPIPDATPYVQTSSLALLKSTKNATAALRFMRFATARDRGLEIFKKYHYPVVEGDAWAMRPEIIYFSGGVNRVAIADTLAAFAAREGVDIVTSYNGCGILVGQIKAGETPDVYHTCDASFMNPVLSKFEAPDHLSTTAIVILVQKGNPKGITGLADLTRQGLQVGVATEKLSTLGTMTAALLKETGLYEEVMPNVVVTSPQGDMLVSQLTVGKLDAAIVYQANAMFVGDKTEGIAIPMGHAMATQTYAVSKGTPYPHLLERLRLRLRDAASKEAYVAAGFAVLPEHASDVAAL